MNHLQTDTNNNEPLQKLKDKANDKYTRQKDKKV